MPTICVGINLDGFWQEKTPVVNSAFLAGYYFNADSFWYTVNEYDGLNPIRAFGGTYILKKDSIELRVEYIKRMAYNVNGICRDPFSPANNQWSILENGTEVIDTLDMPQFFVLPLKMDSQTLMIDDVPFYLTKEQ